MIYIVTTVSEYHLCVSSFLYGDEWLDSSGSCSRSEITVLIFH